MISIKKAEEENNSDKRSIKAGDLPPIHPIKFTAFDGEKIIGEISGEINDGILLINNLFGSDFILDGLCRTIFSYGIKKGVSIGKFHEKISENVKNSDFFGEIDIKEYLLKKNCL